MRSLLLVSVIVLPAITLQVSRAQSTLQLVYSNPANNAVDVDRQQTISITFSADLNAGSVSTSRVTLRHDESIVAISVDVSGNQLSIRPTRTLLPATTYLLIVSGLQSSDGDALDGVVTIDFKTRDGMWQMPKQVTAGSQYLQSSRLAFNKDAGTAMVAWTEHTGALRSDLFASRYASNQWSAPQRVNTNAQGEVLDASIAIAESDLVIAVWEQCYTDNDGRIHFSIWGNAFTPSSRWARSQMISSETAQGGFSPQVAISPDGSAIAVWYQYDHGTGRIFSSRYSSDAGWSAAAAIDAVSNAPGSFNPHIAFDTEGNAYAVWQQWWHGVTLVWANRYVAGRGWIAPQIIQSDKSVNSDASQLAFDEVGNAIVVWTQADGVFISRYALDQGWSTSVNISNGGNGNQPTAVINDNGQIVAAWTQVLVTSTDSHGIPRTRGINWTNSFDAKTGWLTPTLLQDANGFNSGNVSLAVDDTGNALAVWSESNGSFYRIYANRYQSGNGWVRRKVIDTTNSVAAANPHLAIDVNGNGVAVWEQTDADGNVGIWSSRFE